MTGTTPVPALLIVCHKDPSYSVRLDWTEWGPLAVIAEMDLGDGVLVAADLRRLAAACDRVPRSKYTGRLLRRAADRGGWFRAVPEPEGDPPAPGERFPLVDDPLPSSN